MRRVTALLTLLPLALAAPACRNPGNPPRHPGTGEYQDLMRREVSSAESALATAGLVLRELDRDSLTKTYAGVALRQAASGLEEVGLDLGDVTPPADLARPHRRLTALVEHDRTLIEGAADEPAARRARLARRLLGDADEVGKQLADQLGT
jgi:hypothetical protein